MDKKTYSIGILSVTAVVLLVANILSTPRAEATQGIVNQGRDFTVVSSPVQSGGDALYILNNRTGILGVFTYDTSTRRMVPRVVTPIAAAFPAPAGAVTPAGGTVTPRQR
jgi:hypothetical protein